MTASDFIAAGITIEDAPTAVLYAESALDWMSLHTTIKVDKENLSVLPAAAKLFVIRYGDFMSTDAVVTSESLGGMSQSFGAEAKYSQLYDLAADILDGYLKPQVEFITAKSRYVT